MDESALNQAMQTGDLAALEKLLGDYETLEIDDNLPATGSDPKPTEPTPATSTEKVEPTATTAAGEAGTEAKPEPAPEGEKVVLSKDGKHTIPYEVLENQRARARALEQENQQLRTIQAERDKLQALLDKHQIDINADNLENLTDEALAEIADEFPLVGKGFNRLFAEINQLKQTVAQTAAPADHGVSDVRKVFNSVPELVAWEAGDPDRLDYAIAKDKELMADPLWAEKPVRDRFLEAVRRTTSAFGDVVPVKAPEGKPSPIKAKETDPLPGSPSEIGNSVRESATRGTPEYYANLSPSQLQTEMARMSSAELDRLLSSIDF